MTSLHGHDDVVAAFRSAMADNRLHHAWLISGPQGIGKALFAEKAAVRLLAEAAGPPIDAPGLTIVARPAGRPGEAAAKFSAKLPVCTTAMCTAMSCFPFRHSQTAAA